MDPTQQAKAFALQKTGLNWERLDKWSPADRSAYLAALSEFRQKNPGLFSPAEMAAADNYGSAAAARDPEFSYVRSFGSALGDRLEEVGGKVAGVGEGVFSGLSLMRWLIPVAVVVAVLIGLGRLAGASPHSLSRHFNRTRRHAR